MFDKVLPLLYRRLRERAGFSQDLVAAELGVTRQTITNYELGKTRPEPARERRLLAIARCSQEEVAELACEAMSRALGLRVAILTEEKIYQPTTALGRAESLLRREPEIPRALLRALHNKVHLARLLGLALERLQADLKDLTEDCRDAEQRRANAEKPT